MNYALSKEILASETISKYLENRATLVLPLDCQVR